MTPSEPGTCTVCKGLIYSTEPEGEVQGGRAHVGCSNPCHICGATHGDQHDRTGCPGRRCRLCAAPGRQHQDAGDCAAAHRAWSDAEEERAGWRALTQLAEEKSSGQAAPQPLTFWPTLLAVAGGILLATLLATIIRAVLRVP